MIKVLVVDDHVLIRKGIILLLESYQDIELVGEADTGEDSIQLALKEKPDVILMDISMPGGLDGFTAAQEIQKQLDHVKIIFLTMYDEEAYVQKAVQMNADGYILKKSQGSDLYQAIQSVYSGRRFYQTGIPEEQIEKMFLHKEKPSSVLTLREQEIVKLTILGFTNKQISEKLIISPKTVESHKENIMRKLGLKNKQELVQYGLNNHYVM